MSHMTQVISRGPVALPQVANREDINRPCPLTVWLQAKRVAPRIIRVELHSVPLLLAEVHLKGVIIPEASRAHVASVRQRTPGSGPVSIRIDLKEIERIGPRTRETTKLRRRAR